MCVVVINVTDVVNAGLQHAVATVQTKVVNFKSAYKSNQCNSAQTKHVLDILETFTIMLQTCQKYIGDCIAG